MRKMQVHDGERRQRVTLERGHGLGWRRRQDGLLSGGAGLLLEVRPLDGIGGDDEDARDVRYFGESNECPATALAYHEAVRFQPGEHLSDRERSDTEGRGELRVGRQAGPWRKLARADAIQQRLIHAPRARAQFV
jgi:hypothetical protein